MTYLPTYLPTIGSRPDMTFAVDWALSNNYLSFYHWQQASKLPLVRRVDVPFVYLISLPSSPTA